jgi:hypothetical protein
MGEQGKFTKTTLDMVMMPNAASELANHQLLLRHAKYDNRRRSNAIG